jgi:hypothetical protein
VPVFTERTSCACDVVALDGGQGKAHNEEAFRYLLAVERKRASRWRRSFLLLLIRLKKQPGDSGRIPPAVAARIFAGLWLGVRDVDFIGWFREERVIGAVLMQGARSPETEVASRVGQRITETLCRIVTKDIACRLHVRVLKVRPRHSQGPEDA